MSLTRILQTGQYIAGCRTHADYVRAERADDAWLIFVGVPTMTQTQLDRFRSGEIRFTAARMEACLFFLFRFGETPWVCAPVDARASAAPDGKMTFVFVDSDSGVAQEIRAFTLCEDVSAFVSEQCEALLELPYDRAELLKRQKAVLRRYPTGEAVLQAVEPLNVFTL